MKIIIVVIIIITINIITIVINSSIIIIAIIIIRDGDLVFWRLFGSKMNVFVFVGQSAAQECYFVL